MTQIIDRELALEKLRELVKEKGEDFTYSPPGEYGGCQYAVSSYDPEVGDEVFYPSCAVGHVIAKVDPEDFNSLARAEDGLDGESFGIDVIINPRISLPNSDAILHNSKLADTGAAILAAFQQLQDRGVPYGKALAFVETLRKDASTRDAIFAADEFRVGL